MGKGRLQSRAKQRKQPQAVSDNPFESREITRKKHNVFNRKVKGEKRNVARARIRATQNRKNTILLDFEGSRKANDFRDRRFGEDDASLQLEEKMWARIQRERRKHSRSSHTFNLGDDSGASDLITHKGQALEDVHLSDDSDRASDEELGADVVDQLHFGGGAGDASQAHEGQRNRQEILNDIIARSKERKMEKAREKEEQESERERLDKGLDEVLGMLLQKPPEENMEKSGADDYDRMMRELAYEVRAQATDRVQTPEETAKMEKTKLETLEKARLERMSNQTVDHETSAHQDKGSGRRKKPLNDDELSDSYDTNETFDEDTPLAKRVIDDTDSAVSNTDSEMCAELEASEGVNVDEEVAEDMVWANEPDTQDKDACWTETDSIMDLERQSERTRQHLELKEIPYVLDCPSSYEEFLSILAKYARNANDVNIITDRIYKNHRVKLDKRNKAKMHNFYDMLLKRFRRVGSNIEKLSPVECQDRASQLNYLSGLIFDMSAEMPDVASSLWHRIVGELYRQMVKATADFSVNASTSGCWPGVGSLLLLKLLVQIFPCTDFRHSVVTPAMLYLSQCLSLCSVRNAGELGEGVLCSGLLLHCSLGASRLAPEALTFLCSALGHFGATDLSTVRSVVTYQTRISPALRNAPLGWLREATARYKEDELPHFVLGMSEESTSREVLAAALMTAIYRLLRRAVEQLRGNLAFAEMFYPLMNVLAKINPQGTPELPAKLQDLHFDLRLAVLGVSETLSATRSPLQWRDTDPPKLGVFAPKFHENYNMKKGINEDPEKSKIKQLQRQVKREHKGAMRELKRDAVFLERAKADIVAEKEAERKRRLRDNLTWLEEQQATINQQVKLGGKLIAGGGSSVAKGARVGRGH